MADSIIVRNLTAADYEAVRALWEASGLHTRPAGRDSAAAFAAQLASGCQFAIGLVDTAAPGGSLVGVVLATTDSRRGWINRLAVHPAYRRRGLGLRLVAEAERVLRDDLGLPVLAAHVESWNEPSLALLIKAGYIRADGVIYLSKRASDDV